MSLFCFKMAIGTSIFNFSKKSKPYTDDCIFVSEETESFLRNLSWNTELKEFKEIDTIILRQRGNTKRLYTILRRGSKGFTLYKIAKYIIRKNPGNNNIDICNIILQKYKNRLYFTYSLVS